MAALTIHTEKIKNNIKSLGSFLKDRNIHWSLVTKVFSGDKEFLQHVLTDDVIHHIDSVGDSRLTSLKNLRSVNPNMKTIYIKPPAALYADDVVRYADISLNSSFSTITALNNAAKKQKRTHHIIIMIELGELREGIQREDILNLYKDVVDLSNIEVIGIGSNLGCMYGVEPTYDKLMQLSLYKALISARFKRELEYISGGTSITLPLLENDKVPKEINHFRIGEAAFFGISPLRNAPFTNLSIDTFEFHANIIELEEKKIVPDGIINDANVGHVAEIEKTDNRETTYKAILDFGILDVDHRDIDPIDENVIFVGISSDMIVVDLGNNKNLQGKNKYSVGDQLKFKPNYMGVARLLNSKFIDKRYV